MIDWKKLSHAQGPATRVPQQVKALAGSDRHKASDAATALYETLVGQKTWYAASAPAATLLIDVLPKASSCHWILVVLAGIVGGGQTRAWLAPLGEAVTPEAEVVFQVFAEHRQLLLTLAKSNDAKVRAAVLALFSVLAPLAKDTSPIVEGATKDADAMVRASAVLALARLYEKDGALQRIVAEASKDAEPIVRGAAALARLRNEPKLRWEDVAAGVDSWLSWPEPPGAETEIFPWFGGMWPASAFQFLDGPSQALVEVARSRGETKSLVGLLVATAAKNETGAFSKRAGRSLLEMGGLSRRQGKNQRMGLVVLAEELSVDERAIAAAIAGTRLLPAAGFGLPASGGCRLRWIGLSPGGPLEKPIEIVLEGEKVKRPLWRAWLDVQDAGDFGSPIPEAVSPHLSGLDRWYAMVEMGVSSYGGGYGEAEADDLKREIEALPQDERFFRRIAEVADDLAARYATAEHEGTPLPTMFTASTLLFWPLAKAKRMIEPRWDVLVHVAEKPMARDVLNAVPAERREAIVWKCARRGPHVGETVSRLAPVFDLVPSQRIAESIASQLSEESVRTALTALGTLEKHVQAVHDVAKKHAKLQKILVEVK